MANDVCDSSLHMSTAQQAIQAHQKHPSPYNIIIAENLKSG